MGRGFSQIPGVDYNETYAPVVKFTTLRIVLAVAAYLDLEMLQVNIRTAYLYGDVEEELNMKQPEGYAVKGKENLVCRLQKSIYDLKQSDRNWNDKLNKALVKMGFVRSSSDPNLYVLRKQSSYSLLLVYVDDILMASNSKQLLTVVKGLLESEFELSEAAEPSYCLGLEIFRDKSRKLIKIT